jgi:hypothetical protein
MIKSGAYEIDKGIHDFTVLKTYAKFNIKSPITRHIFGASPVADNFILAFTAP